MQQWCDTFRFAATALFACSTPTTTPYALFGLNSILAYDITSRHDMTRSCQRQAIFELHSSSGREALWLQVSFPSVVLLLTLFWAPPWDPSCTISRTFIRSLKTVGKLKAISAFLGGASCCCCCCCSFPSHSHTHILLQTWILPASVKEPSITPVSFVVHTRL